MPFFALVFASVLLAQEPATSSSGDVAFARGDFQTAFTDYNDAIAKNPADVDAVLGMGTLDLYRNDWQNARTYLNRARHLAPDDPRVAARLTVLSARLPKPQRYVFDLQNGRTDIPFVAIDPVPIVRATVGGRTLTLVVDTSAGSIDLTPAAAQAIGVPADGGTIDTISFPGLTVSGVPAAVTSRQYATGGVAVDGAIGTVFLTHFLPTFDYAHNRLTLRRWEASPALDKAAQDAGAAMEPLWLVGDRLLVAGARVDGDPAMLFAIQTAATNGIVSVANATQASSPLPLVSLGRYAQGPISATPLDTDAFRNVPFLVGGALHNAFFRPATLTLDFASMKIIVSK